MLPDGSPQPRNSAVDRFLTEQEKLREVAAFARYRRDPLNWRDAHPDEHGGGGFIDPEVLPLVDALNALPGVCTIQSCCGHRWPVAGDPEGAEHVMRGQLWLRLSEPVMRAVDARVGELLRQDVIVLVTRMYSFQEDTEPHEVLDVMWHDGRMTEAHDVLVAFFESVSECASGSRDPAVGARR